MTDQDHTRQMNLTWTRVLPAIIIASGMLLLLLLISSTPLQAAPNTDALIRIDPVAVVTTTTAISLPVDIRIENVNGLYGADVRLTFDPALLAVQDANPGQAGVQIELGPLLTSGTYFVVINAADNVSGTIRLALTQLNPALPITGSGVLARVIFQPVGPIGASPIHFTQVQLASRTGNSIPATTQDGAIDLQPVAVDLSKSIKLASAAIISPTSQLTYTIVLTNWGSSVASGVTLTDVIPISTTYVPGSLSGSGAAYNLSQNRIEWSGAVPATGSITLSYAVTVDTAGPTTIISRAYISINSILDRVLTVATQVTPSGLPLKHVLLPLITNNF
jgi:uncharacterized repeat protein (TIGR01451 family)